MNYRRNDTTTRVREPVQVYLDRAERARLERLTAQLETTKSDVLRRGLEALERQLTDPEEHPALRIVGILGDASVATASSTESADAAREHDRVLADAEERSWSRGTGGGSGD